MKFRGMFKFSDSDVYPALIPSPRIWIRKVTMGDLQIRRYFTDNKVRNERLDYNQPTYMMLYQVGKTYMDHGDGVGTVMAFLAYTIDLITSHLSGLWHIL